MKSCTPRLQIQIANELAHRLALVMATMALALALEDWQSQVAAVVRLARGNDAIQLIQLLMQLTQRPRIVQSGVRQADAQRRKLEGALTRAPEGSKCHVLPSTGRPGTAWHVTHHLPLVCQPATLAATSSTGGSTGGGGGIRFHLVCISSVKLIPAVGQARRCLMANPACPGTVP